MLDEPLEILRGVLDFLEHLSRYSSVVVDVLRGDDLLKPVPTHEQINEAEHVFVNS